MKKHYVGEFRYAGSNRTFIGCPHYSCKKEAMRSMKLHNHCVRILEYSLVKEHRNKNFKPHKED